MQNSRIIERIVRSFSAIIAANAKARKAAIIAAWTLNLPDLACFFLFLFLYLYWFLIFPFIYFDFRWGVYERTKEFIKKTLLFQKINAAFTQVKEKPYLVFFLNIFEFFFCYAIIYLCYRMLEGDKETFVQILLVMSECSSIYICFLAKNEVSRFQAVYSFFLSYLLNIIILEKLSISVFLNRFLLFLVVEFLLVKYKGFYPFHFSFFVILFSFLLISPEIQLWGFNLVVQLVFLYLLQFLLQKFSHIDPSPSFFFSLPFLLISLLFIGDFHFRELDFQQKILFLGAGSLVIYFCFLSKTGGGELVITTLSYIILNFGIGGFIAYKESVFLRSSILYLIVNLFIFFNLYCASIKKASSLTNIFNQIKVRVMLSKLVFLLVVLSFIKENSTYSWIGPWLSTFMLQVGVLNSFFFFFEKKEEEFFQTLGRKETTFVSRLIIYGSAIFFFLLFFHLRLGKIESEAAPWAWA